jgi:trk system potassium uptake protein TrkH
VLIERDRDDAARVVLATVAPALFATTLVPPQLVELGLPRWGAAAVIGALLLFAAWSLPWWTGLARWSAAIGLGFGAALWAVAHPDRAGTGLVLVLAAGSLVAGLWPAYTGGSWLRDRGAVAAAATVVLLVALLSWSVGTGGPGGSLGLAGAAVVPAAVALRSAKSRGARQIAAVALLTPVVYAVLGLAELRPMRATVLLAAGPLLLLVRTVPPVGVVRSTGTMLLDFVLASPARQLVVSFASLCTIGTIVLQSPVADTAGFGHDLVDAAFTAVSAGCVTGLAVLDTPNDFTLFGQVAILALIQLGGLGIMTFAAGAVLWAGSRLRVRHERVAAELLGGGAQLDLWMALRRVLAVTAVTELTGAVLLFPAFLLHGDTVLMALWRSVFTSVSAFCNAGFALSSNNMVAYQGDPWVLCVVGSIITLGSLGPIVVTALPDVAARRRISLFVRMSVSGTLVLLVFGVVAILLLETHHTFAQLAWIDRFANAWFHAVVPRTAGFNSIDLAQAHPATITLTMLLMFVGGCSGSTAGGIKITTAMVLLLATVAAARTRTTAEFWNRSIRHRTVYEAGAIATVYAGIGLAGLLMFQLTQRQPFDMALFEVLSALGTVGLSIGGTMQADSVGKIVLIALMFAGRVGPLTVFFFLSEGSGSTALLEYPSEEVAVG